VTAVPFLRMLFPPAVTAGNLRDGDQRRKKFFFGDGKVRILPRAVVKPFGQKPLRVNQGELTQLLVAWSQGDQNALAQLAPLVENQLRRIARRRMRQESPGHTLQTTALVHEAYLKLFKADKIEWHNREHFFAIAARIMRQVLVDAARARRYTKRGGEFQRVFIANDDYPSVERDEDLLALNEAINRLAEIDPRKGAVVELKFFAGLDLEEIAAVLKVSTVTVKRDWSFARAWLARELGGGRRNGK
jgi:RNA polymerase sigma factor (TIGR02999 family)